MDAFSVGWQRQGNRTGNAFRCQQEEIRSGQSDLGNHAGYAGIAIMERYGFSARRGRNSATSIALLRRIEDWKEFVDKRDQARRFRS